MLEKAQAAPLSPAWAELDGNGEFVTYVSIIDNRTGDPVFLPAVETPAGP